MIFGYARVSTPEQNISSQISMLEDAGCMKVITDTASGVRENRNGLKELMQTIRKGDTVIVYRVDRIFRSLKNMVELIETFNQMQVNFTSLSEPQFDTTSANGKFLLQIFGAVAEFERNLISERTKIGLVNARKRKKLLGRPKGPTRDSLEKYEYACHLYKNKNYPIDKACQAAGISKTTFYRIDKLKK
ncbi:recombinase family protein [Ancylomarina sp. DW003]|nr:recombinase family protein [Ancylomarina sp. DW003]MDE5420995.1 recombinase family protein [Ancylomarina sp. DW003]